VAVILYDSGMMLDVRQLRGHTRRVVTRLIVMGVPVTLVFGAVFGGLLLGLSWQAAVLVLITRPLVAWLAAARTDMQTGERLFAGWMAPRGIIAAASASTYSSALVAQHIQGAAKILPVTFLVIVVTVAVYAVTAVPVARRLGVTRPAGTRPLLVGGDDWVVDLGRALRSLGLAVLMWAGFDDQRERITQAGLELAPGELLAAATGEGAQLEGITAVPLLTGEGPCHQDGTAGKPGGGHHGLPRYRRRR
jgi:hypothetical protein